MLFEVNWKIEKDLIKLVFKTRDFSQWIRSSRINKLFVNNTQSMNKKLSQLLKMQPLSFTKLKTSRYFKISWESNLSSQGLIITFSRPNGNHFFIPRLRRWKIYVSYDSCISAAPPNKVCLNLFQFLGRGTLPKINEDII